MLAPDVRLVVVDEGPPAAARLDVYAGRDRLASVPLPPARAARLAGDLVAVVGRRVGPGSSGLWAAPITEIRERGV